MNMRRAFTEHPAAVGETYVEHFGVALGFARCLGRASAAALVHAVVPSLCKTTASDCILGLADDIRSRRPDLADATAPRAAAPAAPEPTLARVG